MRRSRVCKPSHGWKPCSAVGKTATTDDIADSDSRVRNAPPEGTLPAHRAVRVAYARVRSQSATPVRHKNHTSALMCIQPTCVGHTEGSGSVKTLDARTPLQIKGQGSVHGYMSYISVRCSTEKTRKVLCVTPCWCLFGSGREDRCWHLTLLCRQAWYNTKPTCTICPESNICIICVHGQDAPHRTHSMITHCPTTHLTTSAEVPLFEI